MMHSAEGETRELAVASLERMVANLQRVEKSAPRLESLISCHGSCTIPCHFKAPISSDLMLIFPGFRGGGRCRWGGFTRHGGARGIGGVEASWGEESEGYNLRGVVVSKTMR